MTDSDRVKLPIPIDADKLASEVRGLSLHDFVEYNVLMLTTPTPRPRSQPVDDYADGSWADWHGTPMLASCPYLSSLVDQFRAHTSVTLVRLLRLAPGGFVKEHCDPTLGLEVERSVIRLTVPIVTNDHAALFLNDARVPMQPGECWYLRFTDPHRVVNNGATERIHLSMDMIPNEWVRSLIEEARLSEP